MIKSEDLRLGQPRVLETDNNLILPVHKWIRLLVTGVNVIHSFGLHSLGLRFDGIPGRFNSVSHHWFIAPLFGQIYKHYSFLLALSHFTKLILMDSLLLPIKDYPIIIPQFKFNTFYFHNYSYSPGIHFIFSSTNIYFNSFCFLTHIVIR